MSFQARPISIEDIAKTYLDGIVFKDNEFIIIDFQKTKNSSENFFFQVLRAYKALGCFSTLVKNLEKLGPNKFFWDWISRYCDLDENFIEEWAEFLDWDSICRFQKLNQNTLQVFADKIDWTLIALFQKLDNKTLNKFFDKFEEGDWKTIVLHNKIDKNLKKRLRERFSS